MGYCLCKSLHQLRVPRYVCLGVLSLSSTCSDLLPLFLFQEQLTGAVSALVTQGNIDAERKERKKRIKKAMKGLGLEDGVVDAVYDVHKLLRSSGGKGIDEALKSAATKAAIRMQILYLALFWEADGKLADVVSCDLLCFEIHKSNCKVSL